MHPKLLTDLARTGWQARAIVATVAVQVEDETLRLALTAAADLMQEVANDLFDLGDSAAPWPPQSG